MPTPDFVLALREKIGHDRLWLGGVTAVVIRDDEVLLVRRVDTGQWSLVTGIVEPGEEPAITARRETLEEAGVHVEPTRLVGVDSMDDVTFANGDIASFLSLTFRCRWISGDPNAADDENTDAAWFPLDALPPLAERYRRRLALALDNRPEAHFRT